MDILEETNMFNPAEFIMRKLGRKRMKEDMVDF
jgi:hypothetical protein